VIGDQPPREIRAHRVEVARSVRRLADQHDRYARRVRRELVERAGGGDAVRVRLPRMRHRGILRSKMPVGPQRSTMVRAARTR